MIRSFKPPATLRIPVAVLAILAAFPMVGCKPHGDQGPREGLYSLPSEAGYSNGLVDQQLLSADEHCLPANDPAPLDMVAQFAISDSVDGEFTLHRLSEGQTWSADTEGVRCSQNELGGDPPRRRLQVVKSTTYNCLTLDKGQPTG